MRHRPHSRCIPGQPGSPRSRTGSTSGSRRRHAVGVRRTEPAAVELRDGVLAGFDGVWSKVPVCGYLPPAPTGASLRSSSYIPGTGNRKSTGFRRRLHQCADCPGWPACGHGAQSAGDAPVAAGEVTFKALRDVPPNRRTADFYFIDQGVASLRARTGGLRGDGRVAPACGAAGTIDSPGARMTFYEPGIEASC